MERLTINTPTGAALKLNSPTTEQEARVQLMEAYKVAVNRLAAYEDSEEITELMQAEAAGQLDIKSLDHVTIKDQALIELSLIITDSNGDTERNHIAADEVLCNLLICLGYEDVIAEYEKINKWYA